MKEKMFKVELFYEVNQKGKKKRKEKKCMIKNLR